MRENEFEKRVQQQLEEFRLRPSGAVWEKVEEGIRKKKKRRVVFFIFLLAGLSLLGYSGYFLLNQPKHPLTEEKSTPSNNTVTKENTAVEPKADYTVPAGQQPGKINQKEKSEEATTSGETDELILKNKTG